MSGLCYRVHNEAPAGSCFTTYLGMVDSVFIALAFVYTLRIELNARHTSALDR